MCVNHIWTLEILPIITSDGNQWQICKAFFQLELVPFGEGSGKSERWRDSLTFGVVSEVKLGPTYGYKVKEKYFRMGDNCLGDDTRRSHTQHHHHHHHTCLMVKDSLNLLNISRVLLVSALPESSLHWYPQKSSPYGFPESQTFGANCVLFTSPAGLVYWSCRPSNFDWTKLTH